MAAPCWQPYPIVILVISPTRLKPWVIEVPKTANSRNAFGGTWFGHRERLTGKLNTVCFVCGFAVSINAEFNAGVYFDFYTVYSGSRATLHGSSSHNTTPNQSLSREASSKLSRNISRKRNRYFEVNDNDKYELADCEPSIEGVTLVEIAKRLNDTDDMSYLARKMRKKFRRSRRFWRCTPYLTQLCFENRSCICGYSSIKKLTVVHAALPVVSNLSLLNRHGCS